MGRQVARTDKTGRRIDRKISGENRWENEMMRKIGEKTTSRRSGLDYSVKAVLRGGEFGGKTDKKKN